MLNKLTHIFDTSLCLHSRRIITVWILEEFDTMYFANKCLQTDNEIKCFILDMIEQSQNDNIIKEINPCKYKEYKEYKKKEVI